MSSNGQLVHNVQGRDEMPTENRVTVHVTESGVVVYVEPGDIGKRRWDFKVSHSVEGGDPYPVTHGDLVCETYRKGLAVGEGFGERFKVLVDHLLGVIKKAQGVNQFPPALVQFSHDDVARLREAGLDNAGEYELELFLVLFELVEIQEFTNYPGGWAPGRLYQQIRDNPEDLEAVAYGTEIVVPRREYPVPGPTGTVFSHGSAK